jgi:hypothetical protein
VQPASRSCVRVLLVRVTAEPAQCALAIVAEPLNRESPRPFSLAASTLRREATRHFTGPSAGRAQPSPPSEGRLLDRFRSGQRQPLRLFTPCISVGAQIGDHTAQLCDQGVGRGVGCRGGFRLVSVARFRAEAVTVGVEVSGQLGVVD